VNAFALRSCRLVASFCDKYRKQPAVSLVNYTRTKADFRRLVNSAQLIASRFVNSAFSALFALIRRDSGLVNCFRPCLRGKVS